VINNIDEGKNRPINKIKFYRANILIQQTFIQLLLRFTMASSLSKPSKFHGSFHVNKFMVVFTPIMIIIRTSSLNSSVCIRGVDFLEFQGNMLIFLKR